MQKRIIRTPLYAALKKHQLTLALTGGLIAAIPGHADTQPVWDCRSGENNTGWNCVERFVDGRQHLRSLPDNGKNPQLAETTAAASTLARSDPNALAPVRNLDWVESEAMNPQQREYIASGCCGAYISPQREDETAELNPANANLDLTADSSSTQDNVTTLTGNVQISQGYRRLRTDEAIIDQDKRTAELDGNTQLREPNLLLLGDSAQIEIDTDVVVFNDATFVFQDKNLRGTAEQLTRTEKNTLIATESTYTSCPPDSNAWQLVADSIEIDNETKWATTKGVRIEVKDVPILYLPYLKFPVGDERKSGLLFPSIELSGSNGLDYAQPYYLNLAPNYDATLTPRYLQERGAMLAAEFRHLSNWGNTTLSGAYLGNDKGGKSEPNTPAEEIFEESAKDTDRWLGGILHQGQISGFSTHIDYTKVSDNLYFRDLGDSTLEVNSLSHLLQMAEVGYSIKHWDFNVKLEQYQTIYSEWYLSEGLDPNNPNDINNFFVAEEKPYKQLPRIDANGLYEFDNGLNLSLMQHFVAFDHDNDNDGLTGIFNENNKGEYVTGQRARFDWGLEWNQQWASGYFTPGVKAKHISYSLDDGLVDPNDPTNLNTDDAPSVTVPVAYFDSGLFFARDTSWLSDLTQTFEPRLYGLYSKFEDQSEQPDFDSAEMSFGYNSLFRDDRFIGGDRIGDSEQISLGLTTRLLDQRSGKEVFRASIGQAYYFEDRKISLNPLLTPDVIEGRDELSDTANESTRHELATLRSNKSPIAADLSVLLGNNIRMRANAAWNEDQSQLDRGGIALHYKNEQNTLLNLGYSFTRQAARLNQDRGTVNQFLDQDIEQANVSTIFPLTNSLRAIALWNYDLTNNRNLETFFGFEYDNCCWKFSLVGRRWIERDDYQIDPANELEEDDGVFFQIQFKGLANSSSRINSILSDGIYGYEPAENKSGVY